MRLPKFVTLAYLVELNVQKIVSRGFGVKESIFDVKFAEIYVVDGLN